MNWLQLTRVQEISQSALAVAVVVLGVVIMLELRSLRSMKRTLNSHLARVFEQLDLLRLDQSTPVPVREPRLAPVPLPVSAPVVAPLLAAAIAASPTPSAGGNPYAAATALASSGMRPEEIARRCGLAAGEARLLASLAAAKAAREPERVT